MKLRNFIVADAVDFGSGGKVFIHGGGVTEIQAAKLPWPQPQLSVLVTLQPEDEAPGTDHVISVRFLREDGSPLGPELESNFRIGPREEPHETGGFHFGAGFAGVVFPEAGLYWVQVSVDETEIDRVPLRIRVAEFSGG